MSPEEISAILDQVSPPLLGVVASLRADGSPHAVPVWYGWDGNTVSIWTGDDRAWVRNLRRDPRVAFTAQHAWDRVAPNDRGNPNFGGTN